MKKTLFVLTLFVAVFAFGAAQAYAIVPSIDGSATSFVGEWTNDSDAGAGVVARPYFLEIFDPNETDNQVDTMDIKHVVLMQELSSVSGDGDDTNDGIYLLIETYATPSLRYADLDYPNPPSGLIRNARPQITMQGDLLGDGLDDGFNIFIRQYNTAPGTGSVATDKVEVCFGDFTSCLGGGSGTWTNLIGATMPGYGTGDADRNLVIEYFVPSTTFGTPHAQFPYSFEGSITYDNGASGPASSDDVVFGTLVPEPGTMMLLGFGLLGLAGIKKFKKS